MSPPTPSRRGECPRSSPSIWRRRSPRASWRQSLPHGTNDANVEVIVPSDASVFDGAEHTAMPLAHATPGHSGTSAAGGTDREEAAGRVGSWLSPLSKLELPGAPLLRSTCCLRSRMSPSRLRNRRVLGLIGGHMVTLHVLR